MLFALSQVSRPTPAPQEMNFVVGPGAGGRYPSVVLGLWSGPGTRWIAQPPSSHNVRYALRRRVGGWPLSSGLCHPGRRRGPMCPRRPFVSPRTDFFGPLMQPLPPPTPCISGSWFRVCGAEFRQAFLQFVILYPSPSDFSDTAPPVPMGAGVEMLFHGVIVDPMLRQGDGGGW